MKIDMTTGAVWRHILLFTLPIMAGNLLQQLYNAVDGVIVGNFVGSNALAAVGTTVPLVILLLALAMGMGVGGGVIVAQLFGAAEHDKLRRAASTILIFLTGLSLLVTIAGLLLAPVFLRRLMQVPEEIFEMSLLYIRIYCLGLIFQFLYNAVAAMLRGLGNSRAILFFLLIASIINIPLSLLFVAGFHWGVGGAAAATVIAQAISAVVSLVYMFRRFPEFRPKSGEDLFDFKLCKLILKFGGPAVLQQSTVAVGFLFMQRLVNSFGPVTMQAVAAAGRIDQFLAIPIFAFQIGLTTFIGQNIGAGNYDRVRRGLWAAQGMSFGIAAVLSVAVYIFAPVAITFFGVETAALGQGISYLRYISLFIVMFSFYKVLYGFLQGTGDVFAPSISITIALTTRIVVAYLLVHFGILGYTAIWAAVPMGWGVGLSLVLIRYLSGAWKRKGIVNA
ncbi:MAG: MATE family efflux transporter [Oscillospiraceae bacterium]|nr:MATE family efflux transporter [Oscillospiraceae bacterium]